MEKELVEIAQEEVARSLQALPEDVKEAAKECPVLFDIFAETGLDDPHLSEGTLGVFEGLSRLEPLPEISETLDMSDLMELMPCIRLFLDNIWDYVGQDRELFRKEVRLTWLHEFGHYLGWDEDEINARGLG